ncbi:252_t:CDS:2 [Gigaspora margarita]|uniref:252_t:CDS:1 n=1 Tax=Gigaspora margarita TaxID=4874 RepID=A0ABM8W109_GIGMA|nr:252_t:CDS:2 [Gigaspora margarita]
MSGYETFQGKIVAIQYSFSIIFCTDTSLKESRCKEKPIKRLLIHIVPIVT